MAVLPRHAVVVLHGIGEQRPLETLTGFVRPLLSRRNRDGSGVVTGEHALYGAPYDLGERYDQRRLKVTWNHHAGSSYAVDKALTKSRQANTDFYEMYWATAFRDTTWKQIWSWFFPLLLRGNKGIRSKLVAGSDDLYKHIGALITVTLGNIGLIVSAFPQTTSIFPGQFWYSVALIAIGVLLASFLGLLTLLRAIVLAGLGGVLYFVVRLYVHGESLKDIVENVTGSVFVTLFSVGLSGFFLKGMGDAARYFNNSPDNVEEIQNIRTAAVDLLHRLHQAQEVGGRPRYERIVVVGHSLGSVIAYDAVRHLWARYNRGIWFSSGPQAPDNQLLTALVEAAKAISRESPEAASGIDASGEGSTNPCEAFHQAQYRLYENLRDRSWPTNPERERWAISDLVTLGSPLAHSDLLLADGSNQFDRMLTDRLLASDPPQFQQSLKGLHFTYSVPRRPESPQHRILHHAAPFAATRWTNIYFPHDLVGGRVGEMFGPGVQDIPLEGSAKWPLARFFVAYPHSSYWTMRRRRNREGSKKSIQYLRHLIERGPTIMIRINPEGVEALESSPISEGASPSDPEQALAKRVRELLEVTIHELGEVADCGQDCRAKSQLWPIRVLIGLWTSSPHGYWIPDLPKVCAHQVSDLQRIATRHFGSNAVRVHFGRSPDIRPLAKNVGRDEEDVERSSTDEDVCSGTEESS